MHIPGREGQQQSACHTMTFINVTSFAYSFAQNGMDIRFN